MRVLASSTLLLAFVSVGLTQGNPFKPPAAKLQVPPSHTYDLQHVAVTLSVLPETQSIQGNSVNTVKMTADSGELVLHAGTALKITAVLLDGKTIRSRRDGSQLILSAKGLKKGKTYKVRVNYSASSQAGGTFGAGGGLHWIQDTGRDGFWTQGETGYNREWAPTWDYPNDMATSETTVTVPKDWSVIGNGTLGSDVVKGNSRTVHWVMTQPHSTYLLSLCAGPFDVQKDSWEGKSLWYVVPRGKSNLIADSFGDTKDMLSFYSGVTGVKYAWPKYAQNAMVDFGGGMENVSATTLGAGSLTDRREGFRNMSGLNAHELAHQWFVIW